MAKDKISIPVEVTGDEAAKRDLQEVNKSVRGMGAAGQDAARGAHAAAEGNLDLAQSAVDAANATSETVSASQESAVASQVAADADERHATAKSKVAATSKNAAGAQKQFSDEAKTAMTGILGRLSPEMAGLANVMVDVAKGIGQASMALLGMMGAGVALGGLVIFFQKLREAAEKAEQAIRRAMDARREATREAMGLQVEVADALAAARIRDRAPEARKVVGALMREGIEREQAIFGAVAGEEGGLTPEQIRHVIGARLAIGEEGELGADPAANRRLMQRLAGVDPELAARHLAARKRDVGIMAMAEAPVMETGPSEMAIQASLARLRGKGWTKEELEFVERYGTAAPGMERLKVLEDVAGGLVRGVGPVGDPRVIGARPVAAWQREARKYRGLGAEGRTLGDIIDALTNELEEIRGVGSPQSGPVIIQQQITNVDTQYVSPTVEHENWGRQYADPEPVIN